MFMPCAMEPVSAIHGRLSFDPPVLRPQGAPATRGRGRRRRVSCCRTASSSQDAWATSWTRPSSSSSSARPSSHNTRSTLNTIRSQASTPNLLTHGKPYGNKGVGHREENPGMRILLKLLPTVITTASPLHTTPVSARSHDSCPVSDEPEACLSSCAHLRAAREALPTLISRPQPPIILRFADRHVFPGSPGYALYPSAQVPAAAT